jgi:hypothetical protein
MKSRAVSEVAGTMVLIGVVVLGMILVSLAVSHSRGRRSMLDLALLCAILLAVFLFFPLGRIKDLNSIFGFLSALAFMLGGASLTPAALHLLQRVGRGPWPGCSGLRGSWPIPTWPVPSPGSQYPLGRSP